MSKKFFAHRVLAAGVLVVALAVSACQKADAPAPPVAGEKTDANVGFDLATVDYQELISLHPDYGKLDQIDKEIALKEKEKVDLQADAFEELQKKGAGRMKTAVEQAKAKLEAERAAIEGEIASLQAGIQAQLASEMSGVQKQMQDELDAEIERVKKSAPAADKEAVDTTPPDPLAGRNEGQVQDYIENLSMVRERNLAARRLELEKQVGDIVNQKKAEVDGQIAAYEADLAAQYQTERLNLQLAAQNTVDEAARTAAEERLAAINAELDGKKAAKRAELEAGYSSVRTQETTRLQSELEAYQVQLNAEVAKKVADKRAALGVDVPQPVAQPRTAKGPPPEIQKKIAEMQARMASELEARKAQLMPQVQAKAAEAQGRLQAKQAQVEAELVKIQKEVEEEIKKQITALAPETKAKIEAMDKKIKELQDQRKQAAEKIAADISREVGAIAQKKEFDMVVGVVPNHEYSSYTDLTELSKVAVTTEASK